MSRSRLSGMALAHAAAGGGDPGDPLFFADFNYEVGKTDAHATKEAAFDAGDGFIDLRDSTFSGWPAGTHIWTVDSIEGDSSGIPGGGRCLALECLGEDEGNQLDYHLSFPVDDWPADLWLQYWIYVQVHAGSGKESNIVGQNTKFGYPLLGGDPSYPLETNLTTWIMSLSGDFALNVAHSAMLTPPEQGSFTVYIKPQPHPDGARAQIVPRIGSGDENILYPNMVGNDPEVVYRRPNAWHLLKMHIKHNGAQDSNTSEFHAWFREKGEHASGFTKYSEYVGGQSNPCGDFNFYNRATDSAPITAYILPSTSQGVSGPWGNTWVYLKDYAVATSEDDLPTYGSY